MAVTKENRTRKIEKKVRFTEEEYAFVEKLMKHMGAPTFQYFARNQIIQGRLVRYDFSELKAQRVALNRIGSNINQIAKRANESRTVSPREVGEVLNLLKEIELLLSVQLSDKQKAIYRRRKNYKVRTFGEWD